MIEPLKLLERNIDRFNRAEPLLGYASKGLAHVRPPPERARTHAQAQHIHTCTQTQEHQAHQLQRAADAIFSIPAAAAASPPAKGAAKYVELDLAYCDDDATRVCESDEPPEGAVQEEEDPGLLPLLANRDRSQPARASEALHRDSKPSRLDLDAASSRSGAAPSTYTLASSQMPPPAVGAPHPGAGTVHAGHGLLPDGAAPGGSRVEPGPSRTVPVPVQGGLDAPRSLRGSGGAPVVPCSTEGLLSREEVSGADFETRTASWGGGGDGWERWWRSDMAAVAEVSVVWFGVRACVRSCGCF